MRAWDLYSTGVFPFHSRQYTAYPFHIQYALPPQHKLFPRPGTILGFGPVPVDQPRYFPRWRRLSTKNVPGFQKTLGTFSSARSGGNRPTPNQNGLSDKMCAFCIWIPGPAWAYGGKVLVESGFPTVDWKVHHFRRRMC